MDGAGVIGGLTVVDALEDSGGCNGCRGVKDEDDGGKEG